MSRTQSWVVTGLQPRALPRRIAQAVVITAGAALLALSARVALPLPYSPVPVTLQTFVVLGLGALLGRRAVASVVLYIAGAGFGLPILAAGYGGLARLMGPTGGYLAGFVLAAYVVGRLTSPDSPLLQRLGALLLGQALIYACGLLWLARFVPADRLLMAGLLPFLAGDAYKLAAAALLTAPSAPIRRWLAWL
ncbi:MAG: biotin transporter BioY [Anaerolineae bacterium]